MVLIVDVASLLQPVLALYVISALCGIRAELAMGGGGFAVTFASCCYVYALLVRSLCSCWRLCLAAGRMVFGVWLTQAAFQTLLLVELS